VLASVAGQQAVTDPGSANGIRVNGVYGAPATFF